MSLDMLDLNPTQTVDRCRYCLMCRHVCPVTHVTRNEATSPHGWGLLLASVERGLAVWNDNTVDILYQCSDCGLCQAHCVTDQPLPLAINAGRAEVASRRLAPAVVYELQQKLQKWGNPYQEVTPPEVSDRAEAVLVVGAVGHYFQTETVSAAIKLLATAGVEVMPIAVGRESPYLANTLGLPDEARALGQATLAEIERADAKRVFVLSPGDIYSYRVLLHTLGLSWPEGVELLEVTPYLAAQLEAGRLAFNPARLAAYTFYDPDQTVRVPGRWAAPRQLLAALSQTRPIELFWRQERAAPCGAGGGLPFTQPELSAKLAQARLTEAQERGVKTLISDDPQVLYHLRRHADGNKIDIKGLFELLAEQLIV
jgi:Fe-S oxidoreductase